MSSLVIKNLRSRTESIAVLRRPLYASQINLPVSSERPSALLTCIIAKSSKDVATRARASGISPAVIKSS